MTMTEDTKTEQEPPRVEVLTPEVVDEKKRQAEIERVEVDNYQRDAVARIADAALSMPGMAGRDEFVSLAMQARVLSLSGAAPRAIKDNPHVALHICMIGRDLGISPSAAVELIDVISTSQGPRPSLSPQLINGQIRRLGLGSIVKVRGTDEASTALAMMPGGRLDLRCKHTFPFHWFDERADIEPERRECTCTPDLWLGETTFTWEDAQTAGIAGRSCRPGDHKKNNEGRCGCNQGYITYPARMMWWRAAGFCADDWFPEAGLGLYSAEELGAVVDSEGRPIDATTAELPPGFEPPKSPSEQAAEKMTLAQHVELWELQERVLSLPEEDQATLRDRWKQSQRLKGVALSRVTPDRFGIVNSILRGVETAAKQKGWDPEAALADLRAREAAIVINLLVGLGGMPGQIIDAMPIEREPMEQPSEPTAPPERHDQAGTPEPAPVQQPAQDGPDPDALRAAIERVQAIKDMREVDKQLRARSLPVTGNADTRRKRLATAFLRDAVQAVEAGVVEQQ